MMDVEQVVTHLLQQEFGNILAHIEFFGPHEEEDIDVIVWLHKEPADVGDRYLRVFRGLRKENLDVPMIFKTAGEEERV